MWRWFLALPLIAIVWVVLITQQGDGLGGAPSPGRVADEVSDPHGAKLALVDRDEAHRTVSIEDVEQDVVVATAPEETVREVILRASVERADGAIEPVSGLRLRVKGRGREAKPLDGLELRTNARGEANLVAEPGAEFDLELVIDSLPEEVIFQIELPQDRAETVNWSRLEVAAGSGPQVIELRMSRELEISGWLEGDEAQAGDWVVRADLLVTPGSGVRQVTSRRAAMDGAGGFRISPLPSGEYMVGITGPRGTSEPSGAPLRRYVDLRQGSMTRLTFDTTRAGATLSGRVLDSRGEPVEGIDIEIYYLELAEFPVPTHVGRGWSDAAGSAVTDEFGRYACDGVAAGLVGVQAGLKATSKNPNLRVLAIGPERLEVEVPDHPGGEVSVPDIPVVVAHSFVVEGRFESSDGEPVNFRDMLMRVEFTTPKIRSHAGWGPQTHPFFEYSEANGRFTLQCDTPSPRVRAELIEDGTRRVLWSQEFDPVPDTRLEDQRYTIQGP